MSPPRRLSIEELLIDPHRNDRLGELGAFALKEALTTHLASTYPDAAAGLLTDLREVTLSRDNLTRVVEHFESIGLIIVMKSKNNGEDYMQLRGNVFRRGMANYAYGIAGCRLVEGEEVKTLLENTLRQTLNIVKAKRIKTVGMKELDKGFRAGMYNYANQVAGIMYLESQYDLQIFWEKFKEHLEPIVSPEDLKGRRAAARAFEAKMEGVIEAVPRYQAASLPKDV